MLVNSVMNIYIAIFGRPSDHAGYQWFSDHTKGGSDFSQISDVTGTPEYLSLYEGMASHNVVESLYLELFNRGPEEAGLRYWTERFENGELDLTNIAVSIATAAGGADLLTLQNKTFAAYNFMNALDTPTMDAAYAGERAAAFGREYLDTVTYDPATVPTQDEAHVKITGWMIEESQTLSDF